MKDTKISLPELQDRLNAGDVVTSLNSSHTGYVLIPSYHKEGFQIIIIVHIHDSIPSCITETPTYAWDFDGGLSKWWKEVGQDWVNADDNKLNFTTHFITL